MIGSCRAIAVITASVNDVPDIPDARAGIGRAGPKRPPAPFGDTFVELHVLPRLVTSLQRQRVAHHRRDVGEPLQLVIDGLLSD